MIRCEQLTKCYGSVRAIDGVSFTVEAGEVAALLGPNGAGKSTVMRLLTGYVSPTAGRALVGGIDVAEQPVTARRQIGYLPEQVSLYPELTVRRYLAFVGEVKGLPGRLRRDAVAQVIERCGLGEVVDRHSGKLSKGYRQRVGLAQALPARCCSRHTTWPRPAASARVSSSCRTDGWWPRTRRRRSAAASKERDGSWPASTARPRPSPKRSPHSRASSASSAVMPTGTRACRSSCWRPTRSPCSAGSLLRSWRAAGRCSRSR
ncbi:MAG: ABC transporter ATP-binding protein [Deltaproteobacteria bacterium]|nr:MAG: ABC transporter ATP-binding protein [Deltaproteobacteria bacterium]